MELIQMQPANNVMVNPRKEYIETAEMPPDIKSTSTPFIEANTIEGYLEDIRNNHIIPVFHKDNEPVISHLEFIEIAGEMANEFYPRETILKPAIRLSHPIKGRAPDARNKPANMLLEHEKTLYYERIAFAIEIPSIYDEIDGNTLSLCMGGVKAYNLDNLSSKKGSDEHFKIFVGFKNRVCTNLCVWSDGLYGDIKVNSLGMLKAVIRNMLEKYNASFHLQQMSKLTKHAITEQQFAHLVGKCRMYPHLPKQKQNTISPLLFGDTQLGMVCKDYYKDNSFCRDEAGNINLWRLYNLFTGANKSTYIDNYLDRNVNAYHFVESLRFALKEKTPNWFLN